MSPQDNETSNDNDLTNENENENCQEGPDIIITSNEINKIIPIASNPIHTTNATNNNNIMKPNYPIKSNSCNKRRGRPRLYAVNPMTGKSMKGRLLSNSPNSYSLTNPKSASLWLSSICPKEGVARPQEDREVVRKDQSRDQSWILIKTCPKCLTDSQPTNRSSFTTIPLPV